MRQAHGPPQQAHWAASQPQVSFSAAASPPSGASLRWDAGPGYLVPDDSAESLPLGLPKSSTEDLEQGGYTATAAGGGAAVTGVQQQICCGRLGRRACICLVLAGVLLAAVAVAGGAAGIAFAAKKGSGDSPSAVAPAMSPASSPVNSKAPSSSPAGRPVQPAAAEPPFELPPPPPVSPVCANPAAVNYNDTGKLLVLDVASEAGRAVESAADCCQECVATMKCNLYAFCNPGGDSTGCGEVNGCSLFLDKYDPGSGGRPPKCNTDGQWPRGMCTLKTVTNAAQLEATGGSDSKGWMSGVFTSAS